MEISSPQTASTSSVEGDNTSDFSQLSKAELITLVKAITQQNQKINARLEAMNDVVSEWCQMNFSPRVKVTPKQDELDGLAYGVNLMVEEFEYLHSKELTEQNKELSNLIYSSSHNLKGPLCTMEGLLSLVGENEPLSNDLRTDMEEVLTDSKATLDNLQKCAYAVNYKPNAQKFSVRLAVSEAVKNVEMHNMDVIVDSQLQNIHSDKSAFVYVLTELIQNAACHAYPNQEKGQIKISVVQFMRYWEIQVEDFGLGIPVEVQQNIFNMFFRGDSSLGCKGLGLYAAKKMARNIDAHLSLEKSEPGNTIFKMKIPLKN